MPPIIALFLCISFIALCFKMELSRKKSVSNLLWLPFIWYLIVSSRPISSWFGGGGGNSSSDYYLEGSPLDRNVFIILIIIAIILLVRRNIKLTNIFKYNRWLCIYLIFCGISVLWSDFPFVAFKRWIKEIGNLSIILVLITNNDPKGAVNTLIKRCAYIVAPLSIVLIKYYPVYGRVFTRTGFPSLVGVTLNKNTLGIYCTISLIWFLGDLKNWWRIDNPIDKKLKWINIVIVSLLIWLLFLTNSATSIVCLFIGIGFLLALRMNTIQSHSKYLGTYIVLIVTGLFLMDYLFDLQGMLFQSLDRNETLTGRTDVWKLVLSFGTNPLS